MVVLTFELKKKSNKILHLFCCGLRFFAYFTMLYHFRKLPSLFRAPFKVFLESKNSFLLFNCFK